MAPVMTRSDSRQRAEDAYTMHLDGYSWQEIAVTLGFRSRQGPQTAVRRHLAENRPDIPNAALRKWIDGKARTRHKLCRSLTVAEADHDHQAVSQLSAAIDRIDDQLARAQGFYAPAHQRMSVSLDTSPVAAVAEWQRAMHELAGRSGEATAQRPDLPVFGATPILDVELVSETDR